MVVEAENEGTRSCTNGQDNESGEKVVDSLNKKRAEKGLEVVVSCVVSPKEFYLQVQLVSSNFSKNSGNS